MHGVILTLEHSGPYVANSVVLIVISLYVPLRPRFIRMTVLKRLETGVSLVNSGTAQVRYRDVVGYHRLMFEP